MIVPRYLPGRWVAVVAEGCVAFLPEGTLPRLDVLGDDAALKVALEAVVLASSDVEGCQDQADCCQHGQRQANLPTPCRAPGRRTTLDPASNSLKHLQPHIPNGCGD